MEGMGLILSHASSKGRQGYSRQFKLEMSPHIVGRTINLEWWQGIISAEERHLELIKSMSKRRYLSEREKNKIRENEEIDAKQERWHEYVWNDVEHENYERPFPKYEVDKVERKKNADGSIPKWKDDVIE